LEQNLIRLETRWQCFNLHGGNLHTVFFRNLLGNNPTMLLPRHQEMTAMQMRS